MRLKGVRLLGGNQVRLVDDEIGRRLRLADDGVEEVEPVLKMDRVDHTDIARHLIIVMEHPMGQVLLHIGGVGYAARLDEQNCRLIVLKYRVEAAQEISLCAGAEYRTAADLDDLKASTPALPNSFIRTAIRSPSGCVSRRCLSSVVFPLPRNPDKRNTLHLLSFILSPLLRGHRSAKFLLQFIEDYHTY